MRISRALTWTYRGPGVMVTITALSSYFAYTTAGLDFEVETPTEVEVTYYRFRWDDGATRAGRAVQAVGRPDHALDWFDPGGTLLDRPTRPEHPHWWNRLGFWWITRATDDPHVPLRYPGAKASEWVGVPSWLVVVVVWLPGLIRAVRLARSRGDG